MVDVEKHHRSSSRNSDRIKLLFVPWLLNNYHKDMQEIETKLDHDHHHTGERYTSMFLRDVRYNRKKFKMCSNALFMVRAIGINRIGQYYESAALEVHSDTLVSLIKNETIRQSQLLIPGCLVNSLFSYYGTRLAWRFMQVHRKFERHGRDGIITSLLRDQVSINIQLTKCHFIDQILNPFCLF